MFRSTAIFTLLLSTVCLAAPQEKKAPEPGPYNEQADAKKDLAAAQARAREGHKMVMVIFGGNWCGDCRVLHKTLESADLRDYVTSHFEIVSVDIGKFDKNLDVVKSVGTTLDKGVPAAAFLASDGTVIGVTNNGELEPSRNYGTKQILGFLHEVVDHHKIVKPSATSN